MADLLFGLSCSTKNCIKLFTRSSRNKPCSFLITLNFYQTNLPLSPQIEIHVRHKETVLNRCAKSHSWRNMGRPVENCDRFARKSIRLPSNSSLVIFTILFQVKVKCSTDQLLRTICYSVGRSH